MNPFEMFKNIGQMKGKLEEAQKEIEKLEVTGSAGGNMVTVTLNGKFEIKAIKLEPICVDNRDIPMLQDLIIAAHHDAMARATEAIKEKMGPMFGGLNIPGMGM